MCDNNKNYCWFGYVVNPIRMWYNSVLCVGRKCNNQMRLSVNNQNYSTVIYWHKKIFKWLRFGPRSLSTPLMKEQKMRIFKVFMLKKKTILKKWSKKINNCFMIVRMN